MTEPHPLGLLSYGIYLPPGFETAEMIEYVARVYYQAKNLGEPTILSDEEMDKVIEKFKSYGQRTKSTAVG